MVDIPDVVNLTSYYLDRNLELGRGDKTAILYKDKEISFSEMAKMANRAGNMLKQVGVEIENRVLLALNDSPEFVATWFGIIKIGAVATDVYTHMQVKDYEYFLNYTRAKVAVVDESTAAKFNQAAGSAQNLKHVIVVGGSTEGRRLSYEDLMGKASDRLDPEPTGADHAALWKFTSGSTGHPKGVALTHRNSIYNYLHYGQKILQYEEGDITLSVPKLFFGYARDAGMVYALGSGASAALFPERSTVDRIFDMIEKYKPTILINVPTMINAMVRHPQAGKRDLSSLRLCTSAGEALPEELYHKWKETFGVEILDGIGSCELYHIYLSNRLGDLRPGSLGKEVPGYEAKILDEEGKEVSEGEVGTLWVKGDSAGLLYWGHHSKTKQTFQGEWVNTGDLFRRDGDGYYWFMGRGGDLLKVGGIFVAPLEIENCLLAHPDIKEAAVLGVPDEQGLIKPHAFIVVNEGVVTSEDLARRIQEYVKANLAPYKYPRWVRFVADLPKDDHGKVSRRALKEREGFHA